MGFRGTGAFPLHGNQHDLSENLSRGSRPVGSAMLTIKTLLGLTILTRGHAFGSGAPLSKPVADETQTFILFSSPYSMENGCVEV